MANLFVKDVPDDTKALVAKIAADQGTTLSEFVRRMLEDVAAPERKRQAMKAARDELRALQSRMDLSRVRQGDSVRVVRATRDDYERGDAS